MAATSLSSAAALRSIIENTFLPMPNPFFPASPPRPESITLVVTKLDDWCDSSGCKKFRKIQPYAAMHLTSGCYDTFRNEQNVLSMEA